MSPNRKADLQRKLAMAPLPKPPAGLAERIKNEIPQHLLVDVRKERQRLSQSIAFNMRVAASVLFLVLSVYLALHVLSRSENATASRRPPVPVAAAAKPQPRNEVRPVPPLLAPPPPKVDSKQNAPVQIAEAKPQPPMRQKSVAASEPAGEPGGVAGGSAQGVEMAPPPPPAVSQSAEAPLMAEAPAPAAKREAAPRAQSGFIADAAAAPLPLSPSSLFGISLANGKLTGVALIEHFAAPAAPPQSLRLDTEAALLDETPLLRVSVDLPEAKHPAGSSLPPVAADAKLDVAFNDDAVVSHRAIAGAASATESVLPSGASVTALYALELKPGLGRHATIATVRLHYRSVVDGKEHDITKKLRRSDIRQWDDASRRMKGTSLAAALVERLAPAETIAEKARAAHLDELAAVAEER